MYYKYENKSRNESRFLIRLRGKSYGIRSIKQRIQSEREKDNIRQADVRILYFSESSQVTTRPSFEIKSISTLGEIAKFKRG